MATGERWYEVFDRVRRDSVLAGWEGVAAEQLRIRTHEDRSKVSDLDDQLREAAKVARVGASALFAARSRIRHSVDGALAAGFAVGEDLSVAYYSTGGTAAEQAAEQARAEKVADDIHQRATQLVGLDQHVAGEISAALAGIDSVTFDKGSAAPASDRQTKEHHGIQVVDWKQSPDPMPAPGPTAQDLRDALESLPQGTRPDFLEIRSEQDLRRFWDWASQGAQIRTGSTYKGIERVLSDGTIVGIRESEAHKTTVDIRYPAEAGGGYTRIHINDSRGGVANIARLPGEPMPSRGPVTEPAPATPKPPRVEPPPTRPAPPRAMPPGAALGPVPPESVPHPVHLPHTHHGLPVLGKDEVADLPEYDPG